MARRRVVLIHWDEVEAEARAARLRRAGYGAEAHWERHVASLRALRADPPDALVIDLERLPSYGRDVGIWLRQQKATRHVPLVFVGGEPEKVARVRQALPDATFTDWRRIRGGLRSALAARPAAPLVPPTPGFGSGTPLAKKLGVRAGATVALLGAPAGFERKLGKLPEGVRWRTQARGRCDLVVLFARSRSELRRRLPAALRAVAPGGGLWLAWPKRSSGVETDLAEPVVHEIGIAAGLVEFKICAVDDTWSALRFARRRPARRSPASGRRRRS